MNLSGKKVGTKEKSKKVAPSAKGTKTPVKDKKAKGKTAAKGGRSLKMGKEQKRPKDKTPAQEHNDEPITSVTDVSDVDESNEVQETEKSVAVVTAFQGGIVCKALSGAVNSHWGRTEETSLFSAVIVHKHLIDGVYIGDIVVRPSFIARAKGSALM